MDTSITGYNIMSTDKNMAENMSVRAQDWMVFAKEVADHIECYTVPQYGDFPNDQLTKFNLLDIKAQLTRYVNRIGSGVRGAEEAERDMQKLAHYACVAYMKMRNEEGTHAAAA